MDGLAAALFLSQGRIKHIQAIIKAHWSFFGGFNIYLKKRKHYQELISKASIGQEPNLSAYHRASIVWKYYAQGKRFFNQL